MLLNEAKDEIEHIDIWRGGCCLLLRRRASSIRSAAAGVVGGGEDSGTSFHDSPYSANSSTSLARAFSRSFSLDDPSRPCSLRIRRQMFGGGKSMISSPMPLSQHTDTHQRKQRLGSLVPRHTGSVDGSRLVIRRGKGCDIRSLVIDVAPTRVMASRCGSSVHWRAAAHSGIAHHCCCPMARVKQRGRCSHPTATVSAPSRVG
jgi:hypothetical protein